MNISYVCYRRLKSQEELIFIIIRNNGGKLQNEVNLLSSGHFITSHKTRKCLHEIKCAGEITMWMDDFLLK